MKVAFALNPSNIPSGKYSGVISQAKSWKDALEDIGVKVIILNPSTHTSWKDIDLIHIFQHGLWCQSLIDFSFQNNIKIIYSPIIDPEKPYSLIHSIASRIPFEKIKLYQNQRLLYLYSKKCNFFLARSEFEKNCLLKAGINKNSIKIVNLCLTNDWKIHINSLKKIKKYDHVFHLSHLSQPRKNVKMLINACENLKINLRLAGNISDESFKKYLLDKIKLNKNLVYLGTLSDSEMMKEMLNAKVFALPSLREGIGLVAMDAAYCGCSVVATTSGGIKEYLSEQALYCNPNNQDELEVNLGKAMALNSPNISIRKQVDKYQKKIIGKDLLNAYLAT